MERAHFSLINVARNKFTQHIFDMYERSKKEGFEFLSFFPEKNHFAREFWIADYI